MQMSARNTFPCDEWIRQQTVKAECGKREADGWNESDGQKFQRRLVYLCFGKRLKASSSLASALMPTDCNGQNTSYCSKSTHTKKLKTHLPTDRSCQVVGVESEFPDQMFYLKLKMKLE